MPEAVHDRPLQMQQGLAEFLTAYPIDPAIEFDDLDHEALDYAWEACLAAGHEPEALVIDADCYAKLCHNQGVEPMAPASWLTAMALSTESRATERAEVVAANVAALAAGVRAMRAGFDWTRAELAERAGMSDRTIHVIENGERTGTAFVSIVALADALGTTVEDMLDLGSRFVR